MFDVNIYTYVKHGMSVIILKNVRCHFVFSVAFFHKIVRMWSNYIFIFNRFMAVSITMSDVLSYFSVSSM